MFFKNVFKGFCPRTHKSVYYLSQNMCFCSNTLIFSVYSAHVIDLHCTCLGWRGSSLINGKRGFQWIVFSSQVCKWDCDCPAVSPSVPASPAGRCPTNHVPIGIFLTDFVLPKGDGVTLVRFLQVEIWHTNFAMISQTAGNRGQWITLNKWNPRSRTPEILK